MNKIQITWLIDFIKNNTNLNTLFWDRVFFVQSLNEQTNLSLYINVLSENRKQISNESLIDFRIISNDITKGPLDIQNYIDIVKNEFEKNNIDFWSNYYQVDIMTDVFIEVNSKKNFEWVFTMIFKNTK